VVVVFDGHTN